MNYIRCQVPLAGAIQDFAWPMGVTVIARYPELTVVELSEMNHTDCTPPPQVV